MLPTTKNWKRGLRGFAVPDRYKGGRIIAAHGMAESRLKFVGPDLEKKIPKIMEFAARLSKHLGRGPTDFGTVMEPLAKSS